jgi:hypothetical protein
LAQEYGDYPESAVARMLWARSMVAHAFIEEEPFVEDIALVHEVAEAAA